MFSQIFRRVARSAGFACNCSVVVAGARVLQRLLPVERLSLCIVGTTGLLVERICVLTVDADECSRPAIAHFMVAQDEPLGVALGEVRHGRVREGRSEARITPANRWLTVIVATPFRRVRERSRGKHCGWAAH